MWPQGEILDGGKGHNNFRVKSNRPRQFILSKCYVQYLVIAY